MYTSEDMDHGIEYKALPGEYEVDVRPSLLHASYIGSYCTRVPERLPRRTDNTVNKQGEPGI
jgi:hypothetical protein